MSSRLLTLLLGCADEPAASEASAAAPTEAPAAAPSDPAVAAPPDNGGAVTPAVPPPGGPTAASPENPSAAGPGVVPTGGRPPPTEFTVYPGDALWSVVWRGREALAGVEALLVAPREGDDTVLRAVTEPTSTFELLAADAPCPPILRRAAAFPDPGLLGGTPPRGGNGTVAVDISTWPACSYSLSLTTRMALTNGLSDDSGRAGTITFCVDRTM